MGMQDDHPWADGASFPGTQEIVEDLLLTDTFLIKGRVEGKFSRLSHVLDNYAKCFVIMSSVAMVDLRNGNVIRTPKVHINLDGIVLAHELVDGAGDYYRKALTQDIDKPVSIRSFYHGAVNLEISGRVRPSAYDLGASNRFFIMETCTVRGLDNDVSEDFELITDLPYAIVNRSKLAYIYDFS